MSTGSRIARAISILESAPNSADALEILSALNRGLLPRARVCESLIESLAEFRIAPNDPEAGARIAVAKLIYETLIQPLGEEVMATFQAEANMRAIAREQGPPTIEALLGARFDDLELDLGLGMSGARGTWHRLWALLVMESLEGSSEFTVEAIAEVRSQLDVAIGRALSTEEFDSLMAHAVSRAEHLSASRKGIL